MTDLSEVILGLHDIGEAIAIYIPRQKQLKYAETIDKAIYLLKLKKQEKTPVVFHQCDGSVETECGNCGYYLDKTYSRCPQCGKELDWNA